MLLERYHSHNLMASSPQIQGPEQSALGQAGPMMQQPQHPMSMSVAEGALRANRVRGQPTEQTPQGRAQNDRLGGSSMF